MAQRITPGFLRELYTQAGLSPSDQELEALAPVVQAFYDGVPVIEEIIEREDESMAVFTLPKPGA